MVKIDYGAVITAMLIIGISVLIAYIAGEYRVEVPSPIPRLPPIAVWHPVAWLQPYIIIGGILIALLFVAKAIKIEER